MANIFIQILPGVFRDAYEDRTEKKIIRTLALMLPYLVVIWFPYYFYEAVRYFSPVFSNGTIKTATNDNSIPRTTPLSAVHYELTSGQNGNGFPNTTSIATVQTSFKKPDEKQRTVQGVQGRIFFQRHIGSSQLDSLLLVATKHDRSIRIVSADGDVESANFGNEIADSLIKRGFLDVQRTYGAPSTMQNSQGVSITDDQLANEYTIVVPPF